MYLSANRIATLLQPRRLAVHALLERLGRFLRGLKQYSERIAAAVLWQVCSLDSNGRTRGVYRNANLRAFASFSQMLPTYVWTLPATAHTAAAPHGPRRELLRTAMLQPPAAAWQQSKV